MPTKFQGRPVAGIFSAKPAPQASAPAMLLFCRAIEVTTSAPPEKFMRVHKSHIVNLEKIKTFEGSMLTIASAKITVGQSFYDTVMDSVLKGKFLRR